MSFVEIVWHEKMLKKKNAAKRTIWTKKFKILCISLLSFFSSSVGSCILNVKFTLKNETLKHVAFLSHTPNQWCHSRCFFFPLPPEVTSLIVGKTVVWLIPVFFLLSFRIMFPLIPYPPQAAAVLPPRILEAAGCRSQQSAEAAHSWCGTDAYWAGCRHIRCWHRIL